MGRLTAFGISRHSLAKQIVNPLHSDEAGAFRRNRTLNQTDWGVENAERLDTGIGKPAADNFANGSRAARIRKPHTQGALFGRTAGKRRDTQFDLRLLAQNHHFQGQVEAGADGRARGFHCGDRLAANRDDLVAGPQAARFSRGSRGNVFNQNFARNRDARLGNNQGHDHHRSE